MDTNIDARIDLLMNEIITENQEVFDFTGHCISNEELDNLENMLELVLENNIRKKSDTNENDHSVDQFRFAESFLEKWK